MILEIIWQDILFYIICGVIGLILLGSIPQDIITFIGPIVIFAVMVIGVITYVIWYLTSLKAGWYDLGYLSVFGIGIGIMSIILIIYLIVEKYNHK